MGRHANPDIRRAFVEFQDSDTPSKCNKVRCLHCGYVRAKNTTRQIEHLQECANFLASPEGQIAVQEAPQAQGSQNAGVLSGQHPNPNLQINRRGPNMKRNRDGQMVVVASPLAQTPAPSLTSHLLAMYAGEVARATQLPFLSHAGCGSLGQRPMAQWLVQDAHCARGFIRFIGQLLGKIRLPQTQNSQFHLSYRTMDLLISALNNTRREMGFFEITATKYGITLSPDLPSPITRSLLDLYSSASSPSASLLEGMIVMWASQHNYRCAWQFATSFSTALSTPSTETHVIALHQALMPNWTSPSFYKFVDASRALVDEIANVTTSRDGKEEMMRCEEIFRQLCYLQENFWPRVDPMGEEDDSARPNTATVAMGGLDNSMMMGVPMRSGMNGAIPGQINTNNQVNGNGQRNGNGRANGNNNSNQAIPTGAPKSTSAAAAQSISSVSSGHSAPSIATAQMQPNVASNATAAS